MAEREILTEQARMEEFMFLGLRLTEGISEERFFRLFGRSLDDVYGKVLNELTCQELIEQYEKDDTVFWRLTKRGIDAVSYTHLSLFRMRADGCNQQCHEYSSGGNVYPDNYNRCNYCMRCGFK